MLAARKERMSPKFKTRDKTEKNLVKEIWNKKTLSRPSVLSIEPGECWLDIGANIGVWTVYALKHGARVVAVEPSKSNIELARENVARNGGNKRVKFIRKAVVSKSSGRTDLYVAPRSERKNTTNPDLKMDLNRYTKTAVPAISYTKLFKQYPRCRNVKINTFGSETDIIRPNYLKHIKKLILSYNFKSNQSIPDYRRAVKLIKKHFPFVSAPKLKGSVHTFFPHSVIIFASK